ncbi:hypothetical protein [Oscillibacter sp.]|uniref:hypothetical protein n=1 Tax=Oscillibacter sp. TaxID=1945593 RepID=UPI00289DB285|nr:hypothetical protein [Oscillibacter sp.]
MTDLMRCIYDRALNTRFTARLCTDEYRDLDLPLQRGLDNLDQTLAEPQRAALRVYLETLEQQRALELEAMFQTGFSVCRAMLGAI